MDKITLFNDIALVLASIGSWILSKRWIFPLFVDAYHWLRKEKKEYDDNNIDATKELANIKENNNNVYENQINFLVSQINSLEEQLLQYSEQLKQLRQEILTLNSSLYSKSMTIGKLRSMSCCVEECKFRQLCNDENVIEYDKDKIG